MKQSIIGFGLCLLLVSMAGNVAMYNGYLIDKTKLQITVCTAVAEAVKQAEEDAELPNVVEELSK